MQTRAARSDREPVDLRRLVAGFLRMAPDVAIVGEVRDREALPELLSHVDSNADVVRMARRRCWVWRYGRRAP
jgi:type IV secretory pathway ATPase VirB11/archaellum biosynthesis ATPase